VRDDRQSRADGDREAFDFLHRTRTPEHAAAMARELEDLEPGPRRRSVSSGR
jgi:hypothetical protein